jgi:uncharacterized protein (DUF2267 family)
MSVFEHAVQTADVWIRDMMRELGTNDPKQAYHALATALQTLRDRLGVDEAVQLGAQLPLIIRGLFFEAWHQASTPVPARRPQELTELFSEKVGKGCGVDAERALAAMFELLRRHVSPGELGSLAHVLPPSLAELAR